MDQFRKLYERYYADVYRFALFLTGDVARAEDLTADTFVRAWTARDRIRQSTVRAYLLTITRNLFRDGRRASRHHVPLDERLEDRTPAVDVRVERASALRQVRARLRGVARGDRRALLLYVIRDMSYADCCGPRRERRGSQVPDLPRPRSARHTRTAARRRTAMKITRDVIYDLLPAYFAGEVSADTRALIDEFLATDPEFARMTERFRRLFEERGLDASDVAAERGRLERARSRAERRQISAAFAVAYTLAALFPLAIDLLRGQPFQAKSIVISIVFAAVAFASTIGWITARRARSA